MALETATYISDLVSTNPTASDNISQGDDHIRLLKSTVKATFPNLTGAVTASQAELNLLDGVTASTAELNVLDGITATTTELNYLDGVTSAIQTQIDAKAPLASPSFSGTVTLPAATSIGSVSATELGYLDGVTSALQAQLDGKAASSHTHTAANVTDFSEAVDDRVAALLTAGTGITLTYNDAGNALTIASAAGAFTSLGSATTSSGTSATLSGLDLTGYRFAYARFSGLKVNATDSTAVLRLGTSATVSANYRTISSRPNATSDTFSAGLLIDLSTGTAVSVFYTNWNDGTADLGYYSSPSPGNTNGSTLSFSIKNAATSVVLSTAGASFTAGTFELYGVK